MTTVPRTADSLAGCEGLDALTNLDDVADNLVAGRAREDVAHFSCGNGYVGEADAAGEDFNEDLASAGGFQLDVLEVELGALFADDGGFVGLG